MITDSQLATVSNMLGVLMMVLVVAFHYAHSSGTRKDTKKEE
jgi:hypothetical protein